MDYWKVREVEAREKLLDASINILQDNLRRKYIATSRRLIQEISDLYAKILAENDNPLASHLYQYNRYYELIGQLNQTLDKLGAAEQHEFSKAMKDLYIKNQKVISKFAGFDAKIDDELVEKAVNGIWTMDGKNFSDRIWNNKQVLVSRLGETLTDAIAAGVSPDRLTKDLMRDFNVSYNNASRLVRTELAHIQIQSTVDKYKEAGVEYARILTEPDCCDRCAAYRNKKIPISQASSVVPVHPNCRCSILAIV